MADDFFDFPSITRVIVVAGCTGDIGVEIVHEDVGATSAHGMIRTVKQRYEELVLPSA